MKTCEKCGASNDADTKFCVGCGNNLSNVIDKSNYHHAETGVKKCVQCGTDNEPDTKFCVGCGNNLSDNYHAAPSNYPGHMDAPRQERSFSDLEMTDEIRASLQQIPNPVAVFWEKLLFPERMILVGALLGCVAAVFLGGSDSSNGVVLAIFYFLSMAGSLTLLYISQGSSVVKRVELARWQIALGAFWLAMYLTSALYSLGGYSPAGSFVFGLWLSFFSSVAVFVGAIMLQGILVQHVFKRKQK